MTVLKTERLILRPAVPADAGPLHAVFSDREAMRYWSSEAHTDPRETEAWIAKMIAGSGSDAADFIVEHEGRPIGKAGGWKLPEVGYILAREHWGKGFAREAMVAVVDHVFATRPALEALTADVDPRNPASIRLLERLGFVETHRASRTWHIGGEWCDSVYFALRRPTL